MKWGNIEIRVLQAIDGLDICSLYIWWIILYSSSDSYVVDELLKLTSYILHIYSWTEVVSVDNNFTVYIYLAVN
jgi:hypothetical protein